MVILVNFQWKFRLILFPGSSGLVLSSIDPVHISRTQYCTFMPLNPDSLMNNCWRERRLLLLRIVLLPQSTAISPVSTGSNSTVSASDASWGLSVSSMWVVLYAGCVGFWLGVAWRNLSKTCLVDSLSLNIVYSLFFSAKVIQIALHRLIRTICTGRHYQRNLRDLTSVEVRETL